MEKTKQKTKQSVAILAAIFAVVATAGNEANPDAIELAPIPVPVSFTRDMDRPVAFDPSATVVVDCHDTASVPWLRSHFADWFGAQAPKVEAGVAGLNLLDGDSGPLWPGIVPSSEYRLNIGNMSPDVYGRIW